MRASSRIAGLDWRDPVVSQSALGGYRMRMQMITGAEQRETAARACGVSLVFTPGCRPDLARIDSLLSAAEPSGPRAMISHRPPESEGWVELLASGLTFELHGLAPGQSARVGEPEHCFGLSRGAMPERLEALSLIPSGHIAAGARMLPVVRTITGLAVGFALLLPVAAVCWEPADNWMEPTYFGRVIVSWLSGGPFPALGLTALERNEDGSVESVGLAFFRGQEIRVEARPGETAADTAKLALRVIDHVARLGPIDRLTQLDSPTGEAVFAEPIAARALVKVWRGG